VAQTDFLNANAIEASIVGARSQVVIPKKIRATFQITQGTRVHFEARNGEIVLTPITPKYFEHMAGCLGTGGKATKVLLEERRREREL